MAEDTLAIIFGIAVGSYLIVYHEKLGRKASKSHRDKILPLKRATAKEHSMFYLIAGMIFCIVGQLTLFGIIHFKG